MSWTTIELIEEGVEVALGDHIIPVEGISSIHPIVVGMGNASWAGERFTGAVVTEGTSVVLPSSYPQHYVFLLQHADNTWHAYTVTPEAGSATFTHDPAWLTEHTLTYPPAVDTVTPARTLFVLNDGHGLTSTTEPDTLIDQLWVLYSISSVVTPHRVADRPTVDDLDDVTTAGILDGEGLIWSTADNKFIPGPLGGGGVGNVTGPSSAEDNNIAVFDGTTGNIIKDGGYTIAELLAQHQVSVAYFVVDATWMTSASWVYTSGVGINLTGTPVTADLIGSYIVVVVDLVTYRCESYEITSTTAATYDQSYLEDRANDEDVVTTTKALQLSKMIYAVYDYVNAADMVDDVRLGSLYWVGYETGSSGHVRIVPVARDDYDFDDIIPTPLTDYIPKSLIDAKGDLIAGTAADTAARLPVGTDGQVLTANSTKSTGLEWVTLADLIVIPVTFVISQLEGPDELPLEAGLFATFRAPYAFTITDIRASLTTASSSGAVEWDVKKNATSVFSTTLTVDASEESSVTAATPAVISTTAIAADDEITVHVVDEGTDVEGGKVYITGMRLALTATYDSEAFEDAVGAMAGTGLSYDDGAGTISADLSSLIPKSIIDAKGDVIVGTAADTAARLAVGADGQVLTADSGEASGVKWAAASPFRKAGRYYLNGMAGGNFTPSLNQLYLTPLPFWYVTISAIAMQVVLSGGAGSVVRLGLYAWGDGEPSGSPIIDAGIVSATSSGVKEVAITPTNVTHACLAMVWQGGTPNAVSGLSATGSQVGGMLVGSATAILGAPTFPATCWTVAGVTGALPSISSVGTLGDFAPRMLVKVV